MAEQVTISGGKIVNEKGQVIAPTTESGQAISFWVGSQAGYDALSPKKPATVYIIV